jgi:ATP-dependent DNA helicase RecQ
VPPLLKTPLRSTADDGKSIDVIAADAIGIDQLRPEQRVAIESLLAGRDTLVVLATGAGKSAIYQVAGLARGELTVVVSPLLALQHDQQNALAERLGPAAVATLNSALTETDRAAACRGIEEGTVAFVYLAPEQLASEEVLELLGRRGVGLFAVDEAHCIVSWGADFRPDYAHLGSVIERLRSPVTVAVTATASPPIRSEIIESLGMRDPLVQVSGFDRPNLELAVRMFADPVEQRKALLNFVIHSEKPGIVYAATRAHSETIAEELRSEGCRARAYHAGLRKAERTEVHEQFLDESVDVVVATTAFGMGIDKGNVRFVAHAAISDSLDSYYQEIGRAGRDGEPADALLFYRAEDLGLRSFFAGSAADLNAARQVLNLLQAGKGPIPLADLAKHSDLGKKKVTRILAQLHAVESATLGEGGALAVPGTRIDEAVAKIAANAEKRTAFDSSRLQMMRGYAESTSCRRSVLLSYFGEPYETRCDRCDNCLAARETGERQPPENTDARAFRASERVRHDQFGDGTVMRIEDNQLTVLFDETGYRTLAADVVVEAKLLEHLS